MNKLKALIRITFCIALFLLLLTGCADREQYIIDPPLENDLTGLSGALSGELNITDSPYLVTSDIFVEANDTLIIEHGVELFFTKNKGLSVSGTIIADGSRLKPILFTAEEYWKGILLSNSANMEMKFAILEKAQNYNDTSVVQGGAITILHSNAVISNSLFLNNNSKNGGALFVESSTADVRNCIFKDNYAAYFGGAIFADSSDLTAINNTFYKNKTDNFGGGIVLYKNKTSIIHNNIFHLNIYQSGGPGISVSVEEDSSDLRFNYISFGSNDPMFVSENDLHLLHNSPCRNAGNPDNSLNDTDGSRNDQGAYGGPLGNW